MQIHEEPNQGNHLIVIQLDKLASFQTQQYNHDRTKRHKTFKREIGQMRAPSGPRQSARRSNGVDRPITIDTFCDIKFHLYIVEICKE
jgi:hypothetical protein